MMNRLIQWILSKVFPYGGSDEPVMSARDWDKYKFNEEEFHGGRDGTGR